ncbi:hypothetical protein C8Q76DRAFT_802971 [Earliella scabrosa]|nr:hypothetical protein C8Q76DRAFT_802971 [Earliella scabrosa]
MAPTTRFEVQDMTPISPRLVATIVGSTVVFITLLVGFFIVSRRSCSVLRPRAAYHDLGHMHVSPSRGRVVHPVGSLSTASATCARCLAEMRNRRATRGATQVSGTITYPPPPYMPSSPSSSSSSEDSSGGCGRSTLASPPPAYVSLGAPPATPVTDVSA